MENHSQNKEQKRSPEELTDLMEEIEREASDITNLVLAEESIIDDMVSSGEGGSAELDQELFYEEDLELDLEKGEDWDGSSTEIAFMEEDAETLTNTSVGDKGKDRGLLAEKDEVSRDAEEFTTTDISNDLADLMGKKVEAIATRLVEERISTLVKQSSKNSFKESEEGFVMESQGDIYTEKAKSDPSTNELATLMSDRIEKVVTRKVEEQIPAIAERIVLEVMKKILLSVE